MWFALCFKTILVLWSCVIQVFAENQTSTPAPGGNRNEGRFVPPPPPLFPSLLYPINAATGILVAIAIPITDLPYQNVFLSYNFESNYNMANIPADDFPGPLQLNGPTRVQYTYDQINMPVLVTTPDTAGPIARNWDSDVTTASPKSVTNNSSDEHSASNSKFASNLTVNATLVRSSESEVNGTLAREEARLIEQQNILNNRILFTRRGFYKLVESRLDAGGIKGKKCLLLAICEASRFPFIDINGVLGNIVHIILTPSTSIKEDLPPEFDKAESAGSSGDCAKYERQCNVNVLDVFSRII